MKKIFEVVETSEDKEEKRTIIEEKIEFIKSTNTLVLIILFAILGLSRFDIIPEASAYAAIFTALVVLAIVVIAFVFEQIKLFESEEEDDD